MYLAYFQQLLWHFGFALAQTPPTPTPTPTPTPNPATANPSASLELLVKQLEFLQDANTRLANSFDAFLKSLNFYLVVIVAIVGIVGAVAAYLFGKTLQETKNIADQIAKTEVNRVVSAAITKEVNRRFPKLEEDIKQDVNRSVSQTLDRRIEDVTRAIEREGVIGSTQIAYFVPNNRSKPKEFNFLKNRGFKEVSFCQEIQQIGSQYDVLVLDFFTQEFTNEEKQEIVTQIRFLPKSALVIYHSFRPPIPQKVFDILDLQQVYYTPANNPVALIGRVVDAAQMAYALRMSDE